MPESVFGRLNESAETSAAVLERISPATPLETADFSAPLDPIGPGGADVAPGADAVLVAAAPGRVKVSVNHAGADGSGTLWLGFGQAAQQGVGEWLEPGGRWEEYYAGAVHVLNAGAAAVRVTWMEWGA